MLEENRRDAKDAEEEATAGVGTGALSGVNHRDTEIIVREFGIDGSRALWSALACERFNPVPLAGRHGTDVVVAAGRRPQTNHRRRLRRMP